LQPVRVVVYGLGPIGRLIADVALKKRGVEVVGAIDIDPEKVGKDLGEFTGLGKALGIKISDDADKVLEETKPYVVLHATRTYLDQVYPEIVRSVKAKSSFISTCETLAYPWHRYPYLAILIDEMAKKYGARVLGTGIGPGYRWDSLIGVLTAVCADVRKIKALLSLDAAKRRASFQKKIGLSMDPEEFKKALSEGKITAHVGYAESVLLLASMLGVKLDKVEETQEPLVTGEHLETQYFKIEPGQVKGIRGYGSGYLNGEEFIHLEMIAAAGVDEYHDIRIEGEPPIHWRNEKPLIPGDIATAAIVVNMIPRVLEAPAGLLTMRDLLLPTSILGDFTAWKGLLPPIK